MGSEEPNETISGGSPRLTRVPLGRSGRRLSFERRLRLSLHLLGLPMAVLCWLLLRQYSVDRLEQCFVLLALVLGWAFAVSILMEQIVRPLQTLANVVAALREGQYSFRARGGQRSDALGDLALEWNRPAATLQGGGAAARKAMAWVMPG